MKTDRTLTRSKILQRIHESSKRYLEGWIGVPAHVHHVAHRMANPPIERPQSRREFQHLLRSLEIPDEDVRLFEKFGYGVKSDERGDRLLVAWEAHTEYYSYQVWHIPQDTTKPPDFGPITFPGYVFPFCPLGMRVNALDILVNVAGYSFG